MESGNGKGKWRVKMESQKRSRNGEQGWNAKIESGNRQQKRNSKMTSRKRSRNEEWK